MPDVTRRKLFQMGTSAMVSTVMLPTGRFISQEHRKQVLDCLAENISVCWELFHTARPPQVLAVSQAQLHLVQLASNILPSSAIRPFHTSLNNLAGLTMNLQGRYTSALRTHRDAYNVAIEANDRLEIARSLKCMANDFRSLDKPAETINCIEAALNVIGHREDETYLRLEAHLLGCLAEIALTKGELSIAHQALEKSAPLIEKIGPNEEFDLASWLQLKGETAFRNGDYQLAIQIYEKALPQVPTTSFIRQALFLLPLTIAYASARERDKCLQTAERAANIIALLDVPTLNNPFTDATQVMLQSFPFESSVRAFVSSVEQRFPLQKNHLLQAVYR